MMTVSNLITLTVVIFTMGVRILFCFRHIYHLLHHHVLITIIIYPLRVCKEAKKYLDRIIYDQGILPLFKEGYSPIPLQTMYQI
ncbi:hypothetical protein D3C77_339100 [compost metagenome]